MAALGFAVVALGAVAVWFLVLFPSEEVVCDPSALELPNRGLKEAPGGKGCPDGMVPVTDFCIDKYQASLVTEGGESWDPYDNPGEHKVYAVSIGMAVPQSNISQVQAGAACGRTGARLCTDAEWLRACKGPDDTTYPYGNKRESGVCNDGSAMKQHPAVRYYGTSDPSIWSKLDNPCINQQSGTLAKTGQNGGCVSAAGAYDMMGNLHEWTANSDGVFRGGYYADTVKNGNGCLYATTAHGVRYHDYSTGFRCCADKT